MTAVHRELAGRRVAKGGLGGTISRRVARILALPAVVILLLLGVVAAGQIQDYGSSRSTSRSVTLTLAVQNLVHELQAERGITAGVLGGNPSFRNELGPARQAVDRQRAILESLASGGGSYESDIRSATRQLDGLAAVRGVTDTSTAGRAATFAYFTARIAALSQVDLGLDRATDAQLHRGASALQALQDLSEAIAQERALLNGVFSAGGFAKGEFVQFADMRAAKQAALQRFEQFATPEQSAAGAFVFGTGAARVTDYFEHVAVDAYDGRHIVVNPQSWWSGLTTVLDDLRQLQQHVGSEIQIRAHSLQQASGQRIAGLVLVVLLFFGGSVYLAALASLSITRPLAAFAAEADSVAAERLPAAVERVQSGAEGGTSEPPPPVRVPARATEEIRSVAAALDRLQTAAYELASEQALQRRRTIESLANLGRRNQNLIRRQIGFITSLEREEIDPAALANLFELDHLATRMRRNAASLLVLVGASSPRQWSSPVPVADVIRAAVSEVEEYRRVTLRRIDDVFVAGSAVGSVAHLLSELIENGLTFSPPDSEVEVQGRWMGSGYLIAITDQGIGMTTEDLRTANARLRGEGDFIAAPTRFLGHFVVGQLARDTSIHVELLPSPVTGVTARVTLPESLLSTALPVGAGPAADQDRRQAGIVVGAQAQRGSEVLALPQFGQPVAERIDVSSISITARVVEATAFRHETTTTADAEPSIWQNPLWDQAPWRQPLTEHPTEPVRRVVDAQPPMPAPAPPPPPPPTPPPPTPAGGVTGGLDRTRNGLRKRVPRDLRADGAQQDVPVRRVIDLDAAGRPEVDQSPDKLRARISALRTGLEQGGVPATAPERRSDFEHVVEDSE